ILGPRERRALGVWGRSPQIKRSNPSNWLGKPGHYHYAKPAFDSDPSIWVRCCERAAGCATKIEPTDQRRERAQRSEPRKRSGDLGAPRAPRARGLGTKSPDQTIEPV